MDAPRRPPYPVIDAHIHVIPWEHLEPGISGRLSQNREVGDLREIADDPSRLIALMDAWGVEKVVMITYVSPQITGSSEPVIEWARRYADHDPERLFPMGGIDPRQVADVGAEMDHLLLDLRVVGIKLHPPHQHFHVNDYLQEGSLRGLATVYEKCIEYGVPVMVHTGTSVFQGARNKFGNPLDLDDVLVDFPELKVIIAHGGRPLWMDETYFLLRRFPNAYLDISSVPPKKLLEYFPWLERVSNRAIYGSDWPGPGVLDPFQNILDFYALPIPEDTRRLILRETARTIFNLDR